MRPGRISSGSATAHYADGISVPLDGPNPRTISNLVVGEGDAVVANTVGLSGMMYAWGQFIDHDLTRSTGDGKNSISITVPNGDPVYADGTFIPLTRAIQDPTTGAGTDTPAIAVNANTGWLDGSMVYGSTTVVAAALRLADGHMLTSAGNNLPVVNGGSFAGDVRVMENPSLTALQTIFVREHNYQVDRLAAADPALSGDDLYQMAKAIVTAEIAHITYGEFLPKLLGGDALSDYAGYDPTVDATLSVEFTGAAYRWGHSTVSAETERKDEQGNVTGPALTLRDTFFLTPAAFSADGGADGFLRHLGSDRSQAMDARIVEDLRSFLFDPPVGQDLAAINIQRGRDLGLGTLNQTRESLGLEAYTDFAQITSDPGTLNGLRAAYASVDRGRSLDRRAGGAGEGEFLPRRDLLAHRRRPVRGAARRRPLLVPEPGLRHEDARHDRAYQPERHHPAHHGYAVPAGRHVHLLRAPCAGRGAGNPGLAAAGRRRRGGRGADRRRQGRHPGRRRRRGYDVWRGRQRHLPCRRHLRPGDRGRHPDPWSMAPAGPIPSSRPPTGSGMSIRSPSSW